MKPILVILSILFSTGLFSQDKFIDNYVKIVDEVRVFNENKDFDKAASLLISVNEKYDKLPEADQARYKWLQIESLYNLACIFSLQKDKKNALATFEKAANEGYNGYKHASIDSDLDYIRKDKRFIKSMEVVKEKGDFIKMLKNSGQYENGNVAEKPKFEYEPETNRRMHQVRKYFNLDSVAGNGDEISKILNMLEWVHNTISHNGSHWPVCEIDAIDIYNYYKTTNKGVNCRALAIVLNECYLSMGFKSRFMTCLPKDPNDQDCHVINSVYSTTLNKWIWVDPTFNAYLKDENGNLLSIEEVRSRLIEDKPIVLNEDANWNNINKQTKEGYIDSYMSKNLYWFQCPARSIFNVETNYRNTNEKYISLIPKGFTTPTRRVTVFNTNDSSYFWEAPTF